MGSYHRRRELGKAFGEAVRRELAARNMKPSDLGRAMLGPTCTDKQAALRGHVYCSKKFTCPTLETVERVAEAIGCPPLDLLPWGDDWEWR